jgi:IS605 OrfB family transposase
MAWEVTRTVRVRLDVPDDRRSDLHATNSKFQYCANRTADWAWRYPDEDCVTSKSEAEAAIYDELRHETDGLHANLVQKAIKRATDDISNCVDRLVEGENTSKPEYDTFSIVYDKRAATYYRDKVSLATVNGRVECEYDLPDNADGTPHGEYLLNDDYSFSTSTVHYDGEADEFYLHAAMERELDVARPGKAEHSKVLGVDCNVDDHIAVTSTGAFIGNADYLNHQRREFEKRRASLQQTGTRSAHLTVQCIGDRFGRWSRDYLHQCSKEIVAEAKRHSCTHIAFEDLEQIRARISDGKKFQQWAFRELQEQTGTKPNWLVLWSKQSNRPTPANNARNAAVRSKRTVTASTSSVLTVRMRSTPTTTQRRMSPGNLQSNSSEGRSPWLEGRSVSTP